MGSFAAVAHAGDPKDLLLKKLKEQFVPTEFNRDLTGIVSAGEIVVLKKDGLLVYRYPANNYPISAYTPPDKSIKYKYAGLWLSSSNACEIGGVALPDGCNPLSQKTLMAGENVRVYDISLRKKEISVIVATDQFEDGRYLGELWFPFEKGQLPSPDEAARMISEVFTIQPAEEQSTSTPAAEAPPPPPPEQRQYDEVAPPPPPPAPTPTISIGQTIDQVIAGFGEPQRKAAVGPKTVFFYTDMKMKVTFTAGKVTGID